MRRVVVLADHTRWGLVSLSSFARLSDVDVFVTDEMLPHEARTQAAEQVGEIVVAERAAVRPVQAKLALPTPSCR